MKKHKFSFELPNESEIVEGLALNEVHPQLPATQAKADLAQKRLDDSRSELARLETLLQKLPSDIAAGRTRAEDLTEALRLRDAVSLMLGALQKKVVEAQADVAAERKRAQVSLEDEAARRRAILEKAIVAITPCLEQVRRSEFALARIIHPAAVGLGLEWPDSLASEASFRGALSGANLVRGS